MNRYPLRRRPGRSNPTSAGTSASGPDSSSAPAFIVLHIFDLLILD
jgi:hypothetical protein